jgi:prolyl oligopeptidase
VVDKGRYPRTVESDAVEVIHGVPVKDPFRWLEDLESPQTRAWVDEQSLFTERRLAQIAGREELLGELEELWSYPRVGAPFRAGKRWLQWRHDGVCPQPVLFCGPTPEAIGDVLLDPETLAGDGSAAVFEAVPSPDGELLAYAVTYGGTDWQTWRVRRVSTGTDLDDVVEHGRFGTCTWLPDGSSFLYLAPEPPTDAHAVTAVAGPSRVMRHSLDSDRPDEVVFATPDDPERLHRPDVTTDRTALIVSVTVGTSDNTELFVKELTSPGFTRFAPQLRGRTRVVSSHPAYHLALTRDRADRGRVVRVPRDGWPGGPWATVIPETEDVLIDVKRAGDTLVCHRLRDAAAALTVHELDGSCRFEAAVPTNCTVSDLRCDPDGPLVHFVTESLTDPGTVWQLDARTGHLAVLVRPEFVRDMSDCVQEQVLVASDDGTRVPVFLARRADARRDGQRPTILFGYGGFGQTVTPLFDPSWALWMAHGGMVAVACLRGGGEFGSAWHAAGNRAHKQNVFDDAHAVAQWLVASGWSSPRRIAIQGKSNGGLLAGGCVTQRPDLYAAAVVEVGVLDMLRFHKFGVGWAWKQEYGDPDVPDDFETLKRYSPLHNVPDDGLLPAVLILTGGHDNRVAPSHSFKFAAALQRVANPAGPPVLLRIDRAGGHGPGKPVAGIVAERGDMLSFLSEALGLDPGTAAPDR